MQSSRRFLNFGVTCAAALCALISTCEDGFLSPDYKAEFKSIIEIERFCCFEHGSYGFVDNIAVIHVVSPIIDRQADSPGIKRYKKAMIRKWRNLKNNPTPQTEGWKKK